MRNVPPPRVIFVGCIAEWLDLDMVARVAREMSDVSFVLVGPVETDTRVLRGVANVTVHGPCKYADVPRYLRSADFWASVKVKSVVPVIAATGHSAAFSCSGAIVAETLTATL